MGSSSLRDEGNDTEHSDCAHLLLGLRSTDSISVDPAGACKTGIGASS